MNCHTPDLPSSRDVSKYQFWNTISKMWKGTQKYQKKWNIRTGPVLKIDETKQNHARHLFNIEHLQYFVFYCFFICSIWALGQFLKKEQKRTQQNKLLKKWSVNCADNIKGIVLIPSSIVIWIFERRAGDTPKLKSWKCSILHDPELNNWRGRPTKATLSG